MNALLASSSMGRHGPERFNQSCFRRPECKLLFDNSGPLGIAHRNCRLRLWKRARGALERVTTTTVPMPAGACHPRLEDGECCKRQPFEIGRSPLGAPGLTSAQGTPLKAMRVGPNVPGSAMIPW